MTKNMTLAIISLLALALTVVFMVRGMTVGPLEIKSISGLVEKNKSTIESREEVAKLTTIDYEEAKSELEKTNKDLQKNKEKYYDLLEVTSTADDGVLRTEQYNIGYLWTEIGEYAKKHDLILIMNVERSGENYNLKFNLKGTYLNICNFIKKIENDPEFLFRIYNFKLEPGRRMAGGVEKEDTLTLLASFTVKNVNIDKDTLANESNKSASEILQNVGNKDANSENTTDNTANNTTADNQESTDNTNQ